MADNPPTNNDIPFCFGPVHLLKDAILGTGMYGQVYKAKLGDLPCAAKLLHPTVVDPNRPNSRDLFEKECRFLSQIRHPNIVQYLGVDLDKTTGLSILLMELMDNSLTHFLGKSEARLPYHVQVNINCDIAQALAFLHTNQILHRDLSSNNVLLIGAGVRAKVTDFGMSKLASLNPHKTSFTVSSGAPAYMPPEAQLYPPTYTEKLDCFQAGVLMVQIITRKFPNPGPSANKVRDERSRTGWINIPIPETERRDNHLRLVKTTHPMLSLAVDCLKDTDTERPSAQQICHRLSALKESPQYRQSLQVEGERDGEIQERDQLIQQLQQKNEEKDGENKEKKREIKNLRCDLQQMEEERQRLSRIIQRQKEDFVREKEQLLNDQDAQKESLILQLQQSQQFASYTCHVSGPGLQSATANHPTHVIVETNYYNMVTANLELISKATPTSPSRKLPTIDAVAPLFPSRHEVSYTAASQGQHKLHVKLNDKDINGSPFTITVYPDPTRLGHPERFLTDLNTPYGITFNSRGEMIVSEYGSHQIVIFDIRGQRIRTFGSEGKRPEQMISPAGIAIDDTDNIYVTSEHKLQKFTSSGELIKCVGHEGSKEGEFNNPRGITLYKNQVYVCDSDNHRIQIFDLDLNFFDSIGSHGTGRGELYSPLDIKFNSTGNMHITEWGNRRVQVMNSSGYFIQLFGQEGEGRLIGPASVLIADQHVYVSDIRQECIVVYTSSGQFVTSFGEGTPIYIAFCSDQCMYISDQKNNSILFVK